MLVLTRRPGEIIWIGPQIRLSVSHVQNQRVKIAIEAPAEVSIRRGELGRPRAENDRSTAELNPVLKDSL